MSRAGYPVAKIDVERAFEAVRVAALSPGDILIEGGAPSVFVYVPLAPGLKIMPMGGYQSFFVEPWMLLGLTGVVRNAERNATVMAEQAVQVLVIPRMPYMKYWHHTLNLEDFRDAVAEALAGAPTHAGSLSQLDRRMLLQKVPMFSMLGLAALDELSAKVEEVRVAAGEALFEQNAIGRSLFVVVEGALHVHDGELILRRLGPGDVLGEMAAITPEPRMASVTADEDSLLLSLNRRALIDLIETNPAVARGVIEVLAQYVRSIASDLSRQGHAEE
jgi:CRP-like cAMP-binding protein